MRSLIFITQLFNSMLSPLILGGLSATYPLSVHSKMTIKYCSVQSHYNNSIFILIRLEDKSKATFDSLAIYKSANKNWQHHIPLLNPSALCLIVSYMKTNNSLSSTLHILLHMADAGVLLNSEQLAVFSIPILSWCVSCWQDRANKTLSFPKRDTGIINPYVTGSSPVRGSEDREARRPDLGRFIILCTD